jgi:hypothetical protein
MDLFGNEIRPCPISMTKTIMTCNCGERLWTDPSSDLVSISFIEKKLSSVRLDPVDGFK